MKDIKKLRYNNYDTSSLLRLFHNTQKIDAIGTCVSNQIWVKYWSLKNNHKRPWWNRKGKMTQNKYQLFI